LIDVEEKERNSSQTERESILINWLQKKSNLDVNWLVLKKEKFN
jgi:hypothetical protein